MIYNKKHFTIALAVISIILIMFFALVIRLDYILLFIMSLVIVQTYMDLIDRIIIQDNKIKVLNSKHLTKNTQPKRIFIRLLSLIIVVLILLYFMFWR
jgi:ABC-type branched-subunit amino acid transport system permease subunit